MEVLSRSQLLARLGSRHALDVALARGEWVRVLHGAYLQRVDKDDLEVRAHAARALLPEHARVADHSLLWLLGVDVLPPGRQDLEVVVPRLAVMPRRHGISARECALPEDDCYVYRGVRILRPARAVIDLARILKAPDALAVVDAVLRAGLVDRADLDAELANHARLRNVCQARRIVQWADARAESPPESRVRHALRDAGIEVTPQYDVHTAGGSWIARVDLAIPALKIAIEYDGREVHERPDVFARDRQRQNLLMQAGWIVLRFSAADLREGGWRIVETVRQALRQARQAA